MSVFLDLVAHLAQGRSHTVRSGKGRRGEVTSGGITQQTSLPPTWTSHGSWRWHPGPPFPL